MKHRPYSENIIFYLAYERFTKARVFVHTGFSSPVRYLWLRQGAYLRVEHMKGVSLGQTPPSLTNIRLGWKGLPGKNTSLLQKSVNYSRKKFYSTDKQKIEKSLTLLCKNPFL
jgi:hypothetical protein